MEQQKLSHLCNNFCKEHCKAKICHCHEVPTTTDAMTKARIIDAEAHKDLLDEDAQCSPDKCWECNNTLC